MAGTWCSCSVLVIQLSRIPGTSQFLQCKVYIHIVVSIYMIYEMDVSIHIYIFGAHLRWPALGAAAPC